jgi:hypothetical protein
VKFCVRTSIQRSLLDGSGIVSSDASADAAPPAMSVARTAARCERFRTPAYRE